METNNKLRESMVQVKEIARTIYSTSETGSPHEDLAEKIVEIAHDALAAPARNCDVGTPKEQAERWYWRYHVGRLCQSCPLGPRRWSEVDVDYMCFSEWLQMPYEEGGEK